MAAAVVLLLLVAVLSSEMEVSYTSDCLFIGYSPVSFSPSPDGDLSKRSTKNIPLTSPQALL